ncbi:hypothetical protein D1872_37140 [compost metagenome]
MTSIDNWDNNRIWSDDMSLHFLYNGQGELEIKGIPDVGHIAKYMDYFITYYDKTNKLSKMYTYFAEQIRTVKPNVEIFKDKMLSLLIEAISLNLHDLIIDQIIEGVRTGNSLKKNIMHTALTLQFAYPLIKLYTDTINEDLIVNVVDAGDLSSYVINISKYGLDTLPTIRECVANAITIAPNKSLIIDEDRAIEHVVHNIATWDLLYLKFKNNIAQTLMSQARVRFAQLR